MFSDRIIKAANGTDSELLYYLATFLIRDIENDKQEAENNFRYGIQCHQLKTSLFRLNQHRDNYIKLQERVEKSIYTKKKKDGKITYIARDDETGQTCKNAYLVIDDYRNKEVDPKIKELERLIGDRQEYTQRAAIARDEVPFDNDNSLAEKKTFILEAVKRKQTNKEIIAMLKEQQEYNDIVLDDDTELYYRYLNGRTHTIELEEKDKTLKAFSDLSKRHLDYRNFLNAQLKLFREPQEETPANKTEQTIVAAGKPWEENYEAVKAAFPDFERHLPKMVEYKYIKIDDMPRFTWLSDVAVFARYFDRVTPVGYPTQWQVAKALFNGIKASANLRAMVTRFKTSKEYSKLCDILGITESK